MTTQQATALQEQWIAACESIGLPYITRDTAARLFAIVYVHGGGEEEMVLNKKFTNDCQYIQRRFGIQGGEQPEAEFTRLLQGYVRELEAYMKDRERTVTPSPKDAQSLPSHVGEGSGVGSVSSSIPDWAHRLMRDRYGMKLHG